jgi:hypothetical protein
MELHGNRVALGGESALATTDCVFAKSCLLTTDDWRPMAESERQMDAHMTHLKAYNECAPDWARGIASPRDV